MRRESTWRPLSRVPQTCTSRVCCGFEKSTLCGLRLYRLRCEDSARAYLGKGGQHVDSVFVLVTAVGPCLWAWQTTSRGSRSRWASIPWGDVGVSVGSPYYARSLLTPGTTGTGGELLCRARSGLLLVRLFRLRRDGAGLATAVPLAYPTIVGLRLTTRRTSTPAYVRLPCLRLPRAGSSEPLARAAS